MLGSLICIIMLRFPLYVYIITCRQTLLCIHGMFVLFRVANRYDCATVYTLEVKLCDAQGKPIPREDCEFSHKRRREQWVENDWEEVRLYVFLCLLYFYFLSITSSNVYVYINGTLESKKEATIQTVVQKWSLN